MNAKEVGVDADSRELIQEKLDTLKQKMFTEKLDPSETVWLVTMLQRLLEHWETK